jgi:hypothetical protein
LEIIVTLVIVRARPYERGEAHYDTVRKYLFNRNGYQRCDKTMPTWEVHNKWAEKLGLPEEITKVVNHLSDFPDKNREFMEFCERKGEVILLPLVWSHDFDTIMKIPKYLQLAFVRHKGGDYVTAWYLHYALDYIRMAPSLTAEEVLTRTEERFGLCDELERINQFVRENEKAVVSDCRA